jgi:hypothetical protein
LRKFLSSSENPERQVSAHSSVRCFDRAQRIADAGGIDSRRANRDLLAEKVSHEIAGASPLSTLHADAGARTCAAAVNATM